MREGDEVQEPQAEPADSQATAEAEQAHDAAEATQDDQPAASEQSER